jgi:hypothetical protein
LDRLPANEYALVSAQLEQVRINSKQILARPGEPYTLVTFPSAAVISVLVPMGEEPPVEAGVIGFEGMVGYPLILGEGSRDPRCTAHHIYAGLRSPAEHGRVVQSSFSVSARLHGTNR